MKHFSLHFLCITIMNTSCTPPTQIKITQKTYVNEQIVYATQDTEKKFQIENTIDITTSTSAKINLVPNQPTRSGSILCDKSKDGEPVATNCTYKPMKGFVGEDRATFTKTNIRGVDSFTNIIFKVAVGAELLHSSEITANDTFCNFIINQTSASCDIEGLRLNDSLSDDVSVQVVNDPINEPDQINCKKVKSFGQNLKVTCSLNLTEDLYTYPLQQNIKANFLIINNSNPLLSMLHPKNISFVFSRDQKIYKKEQTFKSNLTEGFSTDIVWVIDNSKSMKENQAALVNNFNSFINNFTPFVNGARTTLFPFNMAAITTDAYLLKNTAQGSLCPFIKCSVKGTPYLINDSLVQADFNTFSQNFSTIINRGINGNASERSLQSLSTFFSKNSNWHNPNSLLSIVIVSDEEEQSYKTAACPLSVLPSAACSALRLQSLVDRINLISPNADLVKVFSIIDPNKDLGNTYKDLSAKFQGSTMSIYSPFNTILDQIGSSITRSLSSNTLIFQGTLKSIVSVKVDGFILSNINNQDYEIILPNKIRLKKALAPGAAIVVSFDYTNND